MGSLLVTKKGHQFIMLTINHFTKFIKVYALKSLVKQKVARFLYEQTSTQFGTPFEIVYDNGR